MKKGIVLTITVSILTITLWKFYGDGKFKTTHIEAEEMKEQNKQEIKKGENPAEETPSILYNSLLFGDVTKIKLIGDSITAGKGIDTYNVPKNGNVILDNGKGEVYREAAYTFPSWANLFRNYISEFFPNIEFENAGISGKSAKWANENKQYWVSKQEDVVFVMLGTNDRKYGDQKVFKKNYEEFLGYVNRHSKMMIVMSPPPAFSDTEYKFGAKEINEMVKGICAEHHYTFLSQYENVMNYSKSSKVDLNQLLQTDGTHPKEQGYQVMWKSLKEELGLTTKELMNL